MQCGCVNFPCISLIIWNYTYTLVTTVYDDVACCGSNHRGQSRRSNVIIKRIICFWFLDQEMLLCRLTWIQMCSSCIRGYNLESHMPLFLAFSYPRVPVVFFWSSNDLNHFWSLTGLRCLENSSTWTRHREKWLVKFLDLVDVPSR